mmetsp:Transcript_66963/g.160389  ORF Transcript_66963/g.160389 Transcript_66963/m.160389 type:complete len:232 (-) Transcript_66963:261-956(-)
MADFCFTHGFVGSLERSQRISQLLMHFRWLRPRARCLHHQLQSLQLSSAIVRISEQPKGLLSTWECGLWVVIDQMPMCQALQAQRNQLVNAALPVKLHCLLPSLDASEQLVLPHLCSRNAVKSCCFSLEVAGVFVHRQSFLISLQSCAEIISPAQSRRSRQNVGLGESGRCLQWLVRLINEDGAGSRCGLAGLFPVRAGTHFASSLRFAKKDLPFGEAIACLPRFRKHFFS